MLDKLFSPESVAVIGASNTSGKVGHDILANLVNGGFRGTIIPVNPGGGEILGLPVCSSLHHYEGEIDQVIVAVPKSSVLQTVREALAKKTKAVIIISSGFKETGKSGRNLEE